MKNLILAPLFIMFSILLLCGNVSFNKSNYKLSSNYYAVASIYPLTENNKAKYNLGNSKYESGLYNDAMLSYLEVISSTKDNSLKAITYYNLGNTYFKVGEGYLGISTTKVRKNWLLAITQYHYALDIDANDIAARENIEYIEKLLKELDSSNDSTNNSKPTEPKKNESKVTDEKIEKIIDREKENREYQKEMSKYGDEWPNREHGVPYW